MAFLPLLAAVPNTYAWSPKVAIVMILCNLLAIVIGKFAIQIPDAKPLLPISGLLGGMGLPALIGSASFGHLLGTGVILGLANLGAL